MTATAPHHHACLWLGHGDGLLRDGPRRPAHPEFRTSPVPPLESAHWLLKAADRIAATFRDPAEAAAWYAARLAEHAAALHGSYAPAAPAGETVRALAAGQDVVGGWWLTGGRFLSLSLVACPHRTRPEYGCPLGPAGARRAPGRGAAATAT